MVKIIDNTGIIILNKAQAKCKAGIRKGLMNARIPVYRDIVGSIADPKKSGRTYRIRGLIHQASARGESPASFTGDLIESIGTRMLGDNKMELNVLAPYAGWLEEGTKDRRIKPRPYISKTGNRMTREVEQYVLMAIERELSHK